MRPWLAHRRGKPGQVWEGVGRQLGTEGCIAGCLLAARGGLQEAVWHLRWGGGAVGCWERGLAPVGGVVDAFLWGSVGG